MLNKWIKDQQQVPTQPILDVADDEGPLPRSGTRSNPYLAYPELGSPAFHESAVTVNSYDMVDDDDLPLEDEVHENEVREYQSLFCFMMISNVCLIDASNTVNDSFAAGIWDFPSAILVP
jgi:hypothetical protein